MKIKSLSIDGIGGIQHLELSFIDGVNVICGANGIGKTTILDVIADAFGAHESSKLKRNALCEAGEYNIEIDICIRGKYVKRQKESVVTKFLPYDSVYKTGWKEYSKDVFFFGINRNIDYVKLDAVASDPEYGEYQTSRMVLMGIQVDDIKSWFINRYLFAGKEGSLSKEQIANYELAVRLFSVLDDKIKFKTVMAKSLDIMLTTPKGEIYFEYLSSGYKSCIYIILGMIKEIEYRYSENPICAEDFEGVVLIDEIGTIFNSRDFSGGKCAVPKPLFQHLCQCRKRRMMIYATVQRFNLLDKQIRDITADVTACHTHFKHPFCRIQTGYTYDIEEYELYSENKAYTPAQMYNRTYLQTNKRRQLYDTSQLVTNMLQKEYLSDEEILANRVGIEPNTQPLDRKQKKSIRKRKNAW